ncbi:MAG TPA: helix-turn-helix domain-containing protein [Solirubrobacteraceae bacterium]|nr:helix-turn-helix domain-containing protein [Solirubrobacteraceae bacterium]
MPKRARRSPRLTAAERREQLLDVTARLVAERGFHPISVEAVALRAGVTRATVYNHFSDLRELLEAVIERETSRALAQVSETALTNLDEGDPERLMLDALAAYLQAVRSSPTTWRLVLTPTEGAPAALHEKIAAGRAAVLERLSRAVRPVVDHDAELTARVLSAISDEYARLVLTDPHHFSPERLLQHARWWLNGTQLARHAATQPSQPSHSPGARPR